MLAMPHGTEIDTVIGSTIPVKVHRANRKI
jgi:hypothetical protein